MCIRDRISSRQVKLNVASSTSKTRMCLDSLFFSDSFMLETLSSSLMNLLSPEAGLSSYSILEFECSEVFSYNSSGMMRSFGFR